MSKIFNIGLPKTGTVSLNAALVLLGYRSLHNPLDLRFMSYKKGIYNYPRDDWDA
ncbi:MAG: sulfotransferase, partial [Cyanobacteria bacterium J06635_15]